MSDEPMDIDRQIRCVKREIALRESVYPRLVAGLKMRQEVAHDELAAMRAVLETLKRLQQ